MDESLLGKCMVFIPSQSLKAAVPMDVTWAGIYTSSRTLQPAKALAPIDVTLEVIDTLLREVQPSKELAAIAVTP